MSRLEELIQYHCPDGVEVKQLGNISSINRGIRITKKDLVDNGQYPVISGGVSPLGFYSDYNRDENTITIAQYGTAGYVDWQVNKFWANDVCYSIIPNIEINNRFLYYSLINLQNEIFSLKTNAIPAHLPQDKLSNILISNPPLEVQEEIVRILDKFTELNDVLNSELLARQKQYEFYRNSLLNFEDLDNHLLKGMLQQYCPNGVEYKELSNVLDFRNGKGHEKIVSDNGKYVLVNSKFISSEGAVIKKCNSQLTPLFKDEITMVMSDLPNGKALAKCFYIDKNDYYSLNQRICALKIIDDGSLLSKFAFYILNRNPQLLAYDSGVDQTNLKKSDINEIFIPIPPLEVQEEIVRILNKYESLVNDIEIGLPAEIEARQKQYEYYRNKLLTFKELET